MSVSIKTSHLAPARFSKISFGFTETRPWNVHGMTGISLDRWTKYSGDDWRL